MDEWTYKELTKLNQKLDAIIQVLIDNKLVEIEQPKEVKQNATNPKL